MTHTPSAARQRLEPQDDAVLSWIAVHKNELPTPLYLYSASRLNDAAASYGTLFPQGARGFYSLKANPQPGLVQHMASLGIGAEVVSRGEWRLAALAGVAPANVLAGGVSKSEAFLAELCANAPAAIVVESETEWQRLLRVAPTSRQVSLLLRINPGVSFGGLNMAGGTQFGFSPQEALAVAGACAAHAHLDFMGLHVYFGSQRLQIDPIVQAVDAVEEIIQAFCQAGVAPRVVDLGLGCGVPYLARDAALDVAALRDQLWPRWQRPAWRDVAVWFEAGRALVAGAGYFVARVTERKRLHGETFVFIDGGLNVHNPGVSLGRFFQRNPRFYFVTRHAAAQTETVNIVGHLCTSADSLGVNVTAPRLAEGDLVAIPNAGAYCATTALWGFNSQRLFFEGLLTQDDALNMLRPQWDLLAPPD